jgi:hypothetical protein
MTGLYPFARNHAGSASTWAVIPLMLQRVGAGGRFVTVIESGVSDPRRPSYEVRGACCLETEEVLVAQGAREGQAEVIRLRERG